jgi:hypothetical protein
MCQLVPIPVRVAAALLCAAPLVACTVVENAPAPDAIANLSEPVFRCKVEPILARDCSYLGCHGNAETALRVYTPGKLRAGSPANKGELNVGLTDAEHHGNYLSAAAFSFGGIPPGDNWILRKNLPSVDGGYEHKGGAIFTGPDDPSAVAISNWLSGKGTCP